MAAPPVKSSPRDALVMASILKDMGVHEHEPRLINQMLEFTYRYVTDVLDDAKVYSSHANKKTIDTDDVKLAVQCRMDHSFTSPPPRDLLMEIARQKNSQPLPLIKPYSGPRLPPDRYCLSATNYKLANQKKKTQRIQFGLPSGHLQGGQRISFTPVQSKSSVKLQGSNIMLPNMSVLNRGGQGSGITQQKPLVRVTTSVPGLLSVRNPTSSVSDIGQMTGITLGQGPGQMTSSKTGLLPSMVNNPLKRKLEDDDYDNT